MSCLEQANLRYGCAALFSTPSILGERLYTTLEDNSTKSMALYFSKIDKADQLDREYYAAGPQGGSWYGGIKPGD
jgi:hypothetical protein